MTLSDIITEEQVKEFKGVFSFFGVNGDIPIKRSQIETVMRALGQNPSPKDMEKIEEIIDNDTEAQNGKEPEVTFPYFLSLVAEKMQDEDSEKKVV